MPGYRAGPGGVAEGELTVPGDKSISHRALMFGGIASGDTDVTGFLAGEDCLATLRALEAMGVRIERPEEEHVIVHGAGRGGLRGVAAPLDMGNAGTAMRLFMGLLAPHPANATFGFSPVDVTVSDKGYVASYGAGAGSHRVNRFDRLSDQTAYAKAMSLMTGKMLVRLIPIP